MTGEVKIGNQKIAMKGNARTSVYYTQLFQKDFFKSVQLAARNENVPIADLKELAFVMAKQAEGADFASLKIDDYYEWLEQFEELEMIEAVNDVSQLYFAQEKGHAKAKN